MDKHELHQLVGANIKRERERAGYTQEQFSELLGIGSKSLSAVERGVVGVSLSTLRNICEILCISSNTLLFSQTQSSSDIQELTDHLNGLSPSQLEIAKDVLRSLLKAFSQGCDD